jgi:guanine deaminase
MLKCPIQTHVAESLDEIAEVHQRYPDQVDEVDLFAELGLLGPRTILAHGVFLNHQQRREVARTQTALVHCPTGNLFRESGLADHVAHRAAGIPIALGSSIAGGFEPFMPRVAVEGLQTAKAIKVHSLPRRSDPAPTPAEAWWMLTAGGADAIGLGQQVGRIAPGFQADCLVVRPEKWIGALPREQQASALLYTIAPRQIEHVFISGRRVGP